MSLVSRLKRLLVGKPIATKHAHNERLPKRFALPVFASDALSSIAYASEEIMLVLATVSVGLLSYTFNISIAICALIGLVAISYYQTIHAYPQGGGSYIVSKTNLGPFAGKVAGASLLIDYILTVAVSVSSGVLAIISLAPQAQTYMVEIGIVAVALITVANLRGARESGIFFAIPTYTFIVLVIAMIITGLFREGRPVPTEIAQAPVKELSWVYTFLILRAFASGCTALTGIEAISDSTQAFKEPVARNASQTLAIMAGTLSFMFIGSSYLAEKFHVIPMKVTATDFKTVMAQLCIYIFGPGSWFFPALQVATALILFLAANTAYADFPRLSSFIAKDGFLPRQLGVVGDRLVFQNGIVLLSVLSTILIVLFEGDTHKLIPLYAVGVFLSFTLSQFGMVFHHLKKGSHWLNVGISGLGGSVTAVVTLVIFVTKFQYGAWLILVALSAILIVFSLIKRHYTYLGEVLTLSEDDTVPIVKTTALLLVPRLHRGVLKAIAYSQSLTNDVRALHVTLDPGRTEDIKKEWNRFGADIPLVILESPFRSLVDPIIEYIDQAREEDPHTMITVIVPQAVPKRWWHSVLHNNVALYLKVALGSRRNVVVTNVRYFLP